MDCTHQRDITKKSSRKKSIFQKKYFYKCKKKCFSQDFLYAVCMRFRKVDFLNDLTVEPIMYFFFEVLEMSSNCLEKLKVVQLKMILAHLNFGSTPKFLKNQCSKHPKTLKYRLSDKFIIFCG